MIGIPQRLICTPLSLLLAFSEERNKSKACLRRGSESQSFLSLQLVTVSAAYRQRVLLGMGSQFMQ